LSFNRNHHRHRHYALVERRAGRSFSRERADKRSDKIDISISVGGISEQVGIFDG